MNYLMEGINPFDGDPKLKLYRGTYNFTPVKNLLHSTHLAGLLLYFSFENEPSVFSSCVNNNSFFLLVTDREIL